MPVKNECESIKCKYNVKEKCMHENPLIIRQDIPRTKTFVSISEGMQYLGRLVCYSDEMK